MSIRRRRERHTGFNSTNSHSQFDAFDEFTFDDGRATSVVITSNVRNTVHQQNICSQGACDNKISYKWNYLRTQKNNSVWSWLRIKSKNDIRRSIPQLRIRFRCSRGSDSSTIWLFSSPLLSEIGVMDVLSGATSKLRDSSSSKSRLCWRSSLVL